MTHVEGFLFARMPLCSSAIFTLLVPTVFLKIYFMCMFEYIYVHHVYAVAHKAFIKYPGYVVTGHCELPGVCSGSVCSGN